MRLLPYERQLIEHLGCTLEEYLYFRQRVEWHNRERPAEYAHIPDIRNDPLTTSIVLFVVGIVLQGVSYLLTPKPQIPNQKGPQNRVLDSIVGRDRFAPTYGFQTSQELSRYNELIPIVFTDQKFVQLNSTSTIPGTSQKQYVGGIMISPKLVWSRMYSWGNYQSIEMVLLVGQSPMSRILPSATTTQKAEDRAGIYLGQTPLDSFSNDDYNWYYYPGGAPVPGSGTVPNTYKPLSGATHQSDDSRLLGSDRIHGSFFATESATVSAFRAMTFGGLSDNAFSHAFSPSSQLRFGAYNALPNGTPYRLNFEYVAGTYSQAPSTQAAASAKVVQIMGNLKYNGTGRNYARQFGIISHNNTTYNQPTTNNGTKVKVNVDDTIVLIYNHNSVNDKIDYDAAKWPSNFYKPDIDSIDNKSIKNTIQGEHEQQDDLLKIGTKWIIGNSLWCVIDRAPKNKIYDKNDSTSTPYNVTLKCIEIYPDGSNKAAYIGVCDKTLVTTPTHLPEDQITGPTVDIGAAWFPICKAEVAVIQNTRRCEVTEIGIKSNVWTRFNGLCNFTSILPYDTYVKYSIENVTVSTGALQTYAKRASFFNLYVRPANNTLQPNEGWEKLNKYPFCVVGSTPQDQFNFIRIAQPFDQFEYKLRPVTSGEIVHVLGRDTPVTYNNQTINGPCIRLNVEGLSSTAAQDPFFRDLVVTPSYGSFTIYTRGVVASMQSLAKHIELFSDPVVSGSPTLVTQPLSSVHLVSVTIPSRNVSATAREISNGITAKIKRDPDPNAKEPLVIQTQQIAVGQEYLFDDQDRAAFKYTASTKSATISMRLRAINLGAPGNSYLGTTRSIYWEIVNTADIPTTFTGTWKSGEQFTVRSTTLDGLTTIEYLFEVNLPITIQVAGNVTGSKMFEDNSAIAEVSHYGSLITRSCDNGPEHEITYVNENLINDQIRNGAASYTGCAMAGLKIRSGMNLSQLEQLHLYQKQGIAVTRLRLTNTGNTIKTIGPSNIFTDFAYYLLTDKATGTGDVVDASLVDEQQLARTAMFLEANHLYYDDAIVEPQNLREFLARISSSLLCNLVNRGGKFSIEPALPIDSSYSFSSVKVPISGIFTDGNIIEDTFQLEYTQYQDRTPIRVLVRYRTEFPNRFPQEQTVVVYYTDEPNGPLQEFNFTHITSRYHAELFAKFLLSSRRHKTHAVSFKTLPYGLGLAPGDYIRVVTQSGYTNPTAIGIIDEVGNVVCSDPALLGTLPNTFDVYYWDKFDTDIKEGRVTISDVNGMAMTSKFFSTIFAVKESKTESLVYMVESLDLDEEGLVQVTASHFPVDSGGGSIIASEVGPTYGIFTVVEDLSPD